MFKKGTSYANVIASLALFIALGGTATAAVSLGRDSVGSPQIRQDAVRSSEIRLDAVRPPEIVSGAVRSSEIRDEGVKIADVSPAAQTALRGELRVAEDDNRPLDGVPLCGGTDLSVCPNHLVLDLGSGGSSGTVSQPTNPGQAITAPQSSGPGSNWLVQAKLDIRMTPSNAFNRCGLVDTTLTGPRAVLDEMQIPDVVEAAALSAVVRKGAGNPTIALRCTSQPGNVVTPSFAKLTAFEVGTVTGP